MLKLLKKALFYRIPWFLAIPLIVGCFYGIKVGYQRLIANPSFRHSYVAPMQTKDFDRNIIKSYLDEYNGMGNNRIVKYQVDKRPITIIDGYLPKPTIGRAWISNTFCEITLSSTLSLMEARLVLMHEYTHCFGFDHVKAKKDLMNAYLDPNNPPTTENLTFWAQKIYKFLY